MKKHEILQIPACADVDLNEEVKAKEKQGWTLITPILLQPTIFNGRDPLVIGYYTLTFEKEA